MNRPIPPQSSSRPADPAPDPALPPSLDPHIHDPYAALRVVNYRRYFVGNAFSLIGAQMVTYTVGYELYQRTHSTFILGMVGLVQVIPIFLLALPIGHLMDRFSRKNMILVATSAQIIIFTLMGFSSRFADRLPGKILGMTLNDAHVPIMLVLLLFNGACRAINQPGKQSLLPMLVPPRHFANAITWNSSLFETSNVVGPMFAGFAVAALLGTDPIHTWAYALIYWVDAACQVVQWINIKRIQLHHTPRPREPMTLQSMLAGVHFVARQKVILGALTLDMFAVLLGGATALLPAFAEDILHVGPIGLAWLRAAPSVGAVSMAVVLAHLPPMQHAGRNLLWSVAAFGVATIIFGLSHNFWLSLVALFLTGVFDNVSVVVRHSLVQLLTPDEMRGRVNVVNSVFISSSNELGAFESGATATLAIRFFGMVPGIMFAVAAGGVGTLIVVLAVAITWPQLAAVRKITAPPAK